MSAKKRSNKANSTHSDDLAGHHVVECARGLRSEAKTRSLHMVQQIEAAKGDEKEKENASKLLRCTIRNTGSYHSLLCQSVTHWSVAESFKIFSRLQTMRTPVFANDDKHLKIQKKCTEV